MDLTRLVRVPPAERAVRRIADIATPVQPAGVVRPADKATAVVRALTPHIPLVVVDGARLVGVVSRVDVSRAVPWS